MRAPALALALALPLSMPVVLTGCGPKTNLQRTDKEQELLQDSVRLYWEAYRWGDEEKAGAFIEDAGDQVLYKDWMIVRRDSHKTEEANILQVSLGPEIEEPADGHLQTATVYVRTNGYTFPDQIVQSDRVKQDWYRTVNGWFLTWDKEAALAEGDLKEL
jgi:hypothetical protein